MAPRTSTRKSTLTTTNSSIMNPTDADMSLDFDAPQFVDFTAVAAEKDEAHVDDWFDINNKMEIDQEPEIQQVEEKEEESKRATRKSRQVRRPLWEDCEEEPSAEVEERRQDSGMMKDDESQQRRSTRRSTQQQQQQPAQVQVQQPQQKQTKTTAKPKSKPLTVPKEFNFTKKHNMVTRAQNGGVQKRSQVKKQGELTVPKPFQLRTALRTFGEEAKPASGPRSPFMSLAEKVKKYGSRDGKNDNTKKSRVGKMRREVLTNPKSPKLMTRHRHRPAAEKSREDRELEVLAKLPKFRAKAVDPKVMNGISTSTTKRMVIPLTEPKSPAITKPRPPRAPKPPSPKIVKANPIRRYKPAAPAKEPRRHQPVVPDEKFKLPGEDISNRKRQRNQQQVKKALEEEKKLRVFKAQPLPVNEPDTLPPAEHKEPTIPEPFPLITEARGAMHQAEFEDKVATEIQQARQATEFKAQPIPETVYEPTFHIHKSDKDITIPEEITLHTEVRAEERSVFDEEVRRKEELAELERERQQKIDEEVERKDIVRLRKELVHHPRSPQYKKLKQIPIKPSNKPLTIPQSPCIGDKRKRMAKNESSNREWHDLLKGVEEEQEGPAPASLV